MTDETISSVQPEDPSDCILVNTPRPYRIHTESGALFRVGELTEDLSLGKNAMIVTDDIVAAHYLSPVRQSLEQAGYHVGLFIIPNGEASKNPDTYFSLIGRMASDGMCRDDAVFALGGGVVGDIAGFAASTYLRGIRFVQLPTTLLSASDASVGGKTGVNLPEGKNLLGSFWQPSAVIWDPETLSTLPDAQFSEGIAEILKCGMIRDRELFTALATDDPRADAPALCRRAIRIKRDLVCADEHDTRERMLLNFGHTAGHAIELCSGYTLSHGKAVAAGMEIFCRAYEKLGFCRSGTTEVLCAMLEHYDLRPPMPFSPQELYQAALSDKKRRGDRITLVAPQMIGCCRPQTVPLETLSLVLELGCER